MTPISPSLPLTIALLMGIVAAAICHSSSKIIIGYIAVRPAWLRSRVVWRLGVIRIMSGGSMFFVIFGFLRECLTANALNITNYTVLSLPIFVTSFTIFTLYGSFLKQIRNDVSDLKTG